MEVESIVKLVGSGNLKDVELEWMSLIERDGVKPSQIPALTLVLDELAKNQKVESAESLAWAAVTTAMERGSPTEALEVAKQFLLTLNRSEDLKRQTAELYRKAYEGREGLEALVEEAGIAGGRPPRRAIRTLDVCLAVEPGSFVVSRDEDTPARVESVNTGDWIITVKTRNGSENFGPVEFADNYAPCPADDYRVLARFDRDRLANVVKSDPVAIIESVLRSRGGRVDSDELQKILSPRIIPEEEWAKWWSKVRTAVKRVKHIKMEGRAPYILEYFGEDEDHHEDFSVAFKSLGSPAEQLTAFDAYLRQCKAHEEAPDPATLSKILDQASRLAERLRKKQSVDSLGEHLVERQIRRAMNDVHADRAASDLLASAPNPVELIRGCDSVALWLLACECVEQSRPADWTQVLCEAFPYAPGAACGELADRLGQAEVRVDRIDQVVAAILADAPDTYEALCWLWDKGLAIENWRSTPQVTVLTRLLSLLGEVQRSDRFSAAARRDICAACRSTLSARKYERYETCLTQIERGVAAALRTQIQRLDNLGSKVQDDLLNRVRRDFPELYKKVQVPKWGQDDTIYATHQGIARWEADISELVNVKMRENAKAIGEAAEKGDLSENSEYKFALEERDLLRARLAQMQSQYGMSRPLHKDEVPTDHISIGSKVQFRHVASGKTIELTFLSPFEANAEKHIYNYKAPLAQELMGSAVGDKVELPSMDPPGTYEVASIRAWSD